jgi:hypothetical protein
MLHLVAFARSNRYFAVSLVLDDDTAPGLATDVARQLEARADGLDERGGPPPWWQLALAVVAIGGFGFAVRWTYRAILRRNEAADARARGESPAAPVAAPSNDPLGFG